MHDLRMETRFRSSTAQTNSSNLHYSDRFIYHKCTYQISHTQHQFLSAYSWLHVSVTIASHQAFCDTAL